MRRSAGPFVLTLAGLLLAAPGASAQLVEVEGTRFVVEGEPFHVVGANAAVMHGRAHREAMRSTLEAAAEDGLNVVRIWALGEYPAPGPDHARRYAFRVGPEGWIEASFAHLDAVLEEAARLDLRVIVVLANRWGDYGGVTQYLRWEGMDPPERTVPPLGLTAFWDCAACEARYREHARRVVERHRDDPTVFAWELMNEAEAAGASGEEAMLRWMDRQARFVHELDGNHLVSAGHIGYRTRRARELWRRVCAIEGVDYCDSHAYPLRQGVRSAAGLARWIDDRVQLAHHVIEKPLLFGEVGFRTDRGVVRGAPATRWIERFYRRVIADGAAGALVWTYLPSDGERRAYGVYASGPRERQTRALRRTLRRVARLAARRAPRSSNPRLGPERGEDPIFDTTERLRGERRPHRGWRDGALRIDPRRFARAAFEGAGTWDGDPGLPHLYGAGVGEVTYRFRGPPTERPLTLRLRASSELPGAGGGAGPEDTSTLEVLLDGAPVGTLTAPPDDGLGAWLELSVGPIGRGTHELTLRATGEGAGGLCLYARTPEGEPAGIVLLQVDDADDVRGR